MPPQHRGGWHFRDNRLDVHLLLHSPQLWEVGVVFGLILFCWPHSRRLTEVKQPTQQHTGLLGRGFSYLQDERSLDINKHKSSYPSGSRGVAETGQEVLHSSLETGLQRDLLLCLLLVSSSGWGLCLKTGPSGQEDPPSWHPSLRWLDREDEPVTVFKTNTLFLVKSNICLRTKNFNLESIK